MASKSFLVGEVIATHNAKTLKVRIESVKMHPLVLKPVIRHKNIHAHDPLLQCVRGDIVRIKPCPRISTTKNYILDEIVVSANRYIDPETNILFSEKVHSRGRDRVKDYGAELFGGKFYPEKK